MVDRAGRRAFPAALALTLVAVAMSGCGPDRGEVELTGTLDRDPILATEALFFTVWDNSGFEGSSRTRIVLAPFEDACAALNNDLWPSPSPGIAINAFTNGAFGQERIQAPVELDGKDNIWVVRAKSCKPVITKESSSGSISITAVSDTSMEGHFRADFGGDVVSGTFRAALCKPSDAPAPPSACK